MSEYIGNICFTAARCEKCDKYVRIAQILSIPRYPYRDDLSEADNWMSICVKCQTEAMDNE